MSEVSPYLQRVINDLIKYEQSGWELQMASYEKPYEIGDKLCFEIRMHLYKKKEGE